MLLSEICKRFFTLDVSGFVDFIILERRKYNGILPPADRPSDKFSDLWLPTTKQMPSSIESRHIQVPDNIVLRNGQNLLINVKHMLPSLSRDCVQIKQKNRVSALASK